MRTLHILSVVQIAALLFLFGKLSDIDSTMNAAANAGQNSLTDEDLAIAQSQRNPNDIQPYPGEDRLRQIIRDELQALELLAIEGQQPTPDEGPSVTVGPAEAVASRDAVANRLAYYRSKGSVSSAEMQALQIDIARLDPSSRTEFLSELNRAMNSGELKGAL